MAAQTSLNAADNDNEKSPKEQQTKEGLDPSHAEPEAPRRAPRLGLRVRTRLRSGGNQIK
jgi:hypothetical protein